MTIDAGSWAGNMDSLVTFGRLPPPAAKLRGALVPEAPRW